MWITKCVHMHTLTGAAKTVYSDWIVIMCIYTHRYSMCTDLMLDMHVHMYTHTDKSSTLCTDWIR